MATTMHHTTHKRPRTYKLNKAILNEIKACLQANPNVTRTEITHATRRNWRTVNRYLKYIYNIE